MFSARTVWGCEKILCKRDLCEELHSVRRPLICQRQRQAFCLGVKSPRPCGGPVCEDDCARSSMDRAQCCRFCTQIPAVASLSGAHFCFVDSKTESFETPGKRRDFGQGFSGITEVMGERPGANHRLSTCSTASREMNSDFRGSRCYHAESASRCDLATAA